MLQECSFLIPLFRDGDKNSHSPATWLRFKNNLADLFGGFTDCGVVHGIWRDENRNLCEDSSRRFIVAAHVQNVRSLRELLAVACDDFQQRCIYLSIGGVVEFVESVAAVAADENPIICQLAAMVADGIENSLAGV